MRTARRLSVVLSVAALGAVAVSGALGVSGADTITTIAGTGQPGFSGDGGKATSARLDKPWWVAADRKGTLYVADWQNNRVRKIDPTGTITTLAGTGKAGFSGDGGPATRAKLNFPWGVTVDDGGNVYITDRYNYRVRKVDPAGTITTFAGTGVAGYSGDGGPATSARLNSPYGMAVDSQGNVYVIDHSNMRVRRVSRTGTITTFAGNGKQGYSGDGGPATKARLNYPYGVAVDRRGNVYISDYYNNRVRKVNRSGIISTLAGVGPAGPEGTFSGDGGRATSAHLNKPSGIAVDRQGNVYIVDRNNHRLRRVDPRGRITTVAGTGEMGYSGDGGPARSAKLFGPFGVAVDAKGNVYVADTDNNRIRRIGQR
jgi:sugar lactone lactonase YvrE